MSSEELAKRRIGEVLDARYELRGLLGVGMTGAVFEAVDRQTKRAVAVKVMHRELVSDTSAVARFTREAKQIAKVGHPSIVAMVDAGRTPDGLPYMALELLKGRSLGAALQDGPLPYDDVTAIGLELLSGLAAAHVEGIVHRDIKPDNVFLPERGVRVKILDFGIAKNLDTSAASAVLTKPGATVGTPSYMSPEQAQGLEVDARADVWSAGCVLFHAAAGRPPYTETSLPALLLKLVTQRPPPLAEIRPDVPAALARAVDGALVPKVEGRWPSADRMAEVLRGV